MEHANPSLIADIAGELLERREPRGFLEAVHRRLAGVLDLDVYFCYVIEEGRLRLVGCGGVTDDVAREIAELQVGQAVCGTVARTRRRLALHDLRSSSDPMTELIRGLGVRSYVCHPLGSADGPIGTLSFGSRSRDRLGDGDVELLRAVSKLVASAIHRSRMEAALADSEERLRQTMEALPAVVVYVDADLRYRLVNRAYEELIGLPREEVVGRRIVDVIGEREFEVVRPYLERALAGETVCFRRDSALPGQPPRTLEPHYVPHVGSDGRVLGVFAMIHDISDLERATRALRRSEAEYRSTFENAGVGKVECDADGIVRRVNRKLCQMLGREPAAVVGRRFADLTHPDDRADDRESLRRLLASEQSELQTEKRYQRADGSTMWALVTATGLHDDEPRVLATVQDVTERRRVADALRASEALAREQARRLAEADRRKDEFLAVLGHELRNPLAAVSSGVQVLQSGAGSASERSWALDMMGHQVKRLTRLLDDLLDVSRISRGQIRLDLRPLEVGAVVAAAEEATRSLLHELGHRLDVEVEPELLVEGDALRLEQVLVNLLTNAARYTPPRGHIELCARRSGDRVEVVVSDNGNGLSPAARERIFEPFAQVREPGSPADGLGIGLTLVRRLVEMHGGSVTASSPGLGRGSSFALRLPAATRRQPEGRPPADGRPRDRPRSVLVIDDNADAARTLAMLLELRGCRTEVAASGEDGLRAAAATGFDVVLLDLGLPDVPGYEVARRLRARLGPRTPLLVAVTGYGHDEARRRTAEAGFEHHLLKPVGERALSDLLAKASEPARPAAPQG